MPAPLPALDATAPVGWYQCHHRLFDATKKTVVMWWDGTTLMERMNNPFMASERYQLRDYTDFIGPLVVAPPPSSTPATAGLAREELHKAIMNLPCDPRGCSAIPSNAYLNGHRDARHAAAELVLSFGSREGETVVGESRLSIDDCKRLEQAAEIARSSPTYEYIEGQSEVIRRENVVHDGFEYERIMWRDPSGRRCTQFRRIGPATIHTERQ